MMDFVVDWARSIADSTKDSPLWLELIFVVAGMLGFMTAVVLGLVVLAWVISLPERVADRWRARR